MVQIVAELQAKHLHTGYHSSIPKISRGKEVHYSGENGREEQIGENWDPIVDTSNWKGRSGIKERTDKSEKLRESDCKLMSWW